MDEGNISRALELHYDIQEINAQLEAVERIDPGVPERSKGLEPIERFNHMMELMKTMTMQSGQESGLELPDGMVEYNAPNGDTDFLPIDNLVYGYSFVGLRLKLENYPLNQIGSRVISATWRADILSPPEGEIGGRNFQRMEWCSDWMFSEDPTEVDIIRLNILEHSFIAFEETLASMPTEKALKLGFSADYIKSLQAPQ